MPPWWRAPTRPPDADREIFLTKSPKDIQQEKAEASFKRKEIQAREGVKAMADYQADQVAVRAKTARLRELRLAKEEADRKADADAANLAKIKAVAKRAAPKGGRKG
jgi:hypothetical protein